MSEHPSSSRSGGRQRSVRSVVGYAAGMLATLASAYAGACPDCEVGRVARQQVWSDAFFANLGIVLAPFVLIGLLCCFAERTGKIR